jgi:hypothetical protein
MTTKTTKPKAPKISKQDEISIRLASVQLQTSHNKIDIDSLAENIEIVAERLNVLFWIVALSATISVVAFFSVFIGKH